MNDAVEPTSANRICPFCQGGRNTVVPYETSSTTVFRVKCDDCESCGPPRMTAKEAVHVWQQRQALDLDPGRTWEAMRAGERHVELVNHPQHYGGDVTYEVIKVAEAWLTPEEFAGAMKFNLWKYTARAGQKESETTARDLNKAAWYLNRLNNYKGRRT